MKNNLNKSKQPNKLSQLNKVTLATMGIIFMSNSTAYANNFNYIDYINSFNNSSQNTTNKNNNNLNNNLDNCNILDNNIFNNTNNCNITPNNPTPPSSSTTPTPTPPSSNSNTSTNVFSIEQEVVRLVNIERAKNNLPALILATELSSVARKKSEDMNKKKYFSHTSPTYGTPFDMLKTFNISYKSAGENIAKGQKTAQAVVTAWMNSDGHRRNILSSSFTHIGVGFDNYYWTQLFTSK